MSFIAAGVTVAASVGGTLYASSQAKKAAQANKKDTQEALAERERKINSVYDRMGASGKAAIERSTQNGLGAATASATDRGLGNTSVYDTMQGQARSAGLDAQLQLQDEIARGKAGALSDLPIAVPEKPAGFDGQGLMAGGFGALGDILKKIPGVSPNTVQNALKPGQSTPTNTLPPSMNPYSVSPPGVSAPAAPNIAGDQHYAGLPGIAGDGPWGTALKRRGVVGRGINPLAGRVY